MHESILDICSHIAVFIVIIKVFCKHLKYGFIVLYLLIPDTQINRKFYLIQSTKNILSLSDYKSKMFGNCI